MSIRMLARDLYRLRQEVERLEKRLAAAAHDEREPVQRALNRAKVEHDRLRRALEGSKDSASSRRLRVPGAGS